jgi:hypothetical protein
LPGASKHEALAAGKEWILSWSDYKFSQAEARPTVQLWVTVTHRY